MSYLKLLLIRHAESLGNVQKVMEGQGSTELSETGRQQARQLGLALSASPDLPTGLYSSPLIRARQTAEAIVHALDLPCPIEEATALQELHSGIFQGLTWAQAEAAYPDLCAQLMTTLTWQPVPQAETPSAAKIRAKSWVSHILDSHVAGDVIWAVSHEGFMQYLISTVMGCDRIWQIRIAHTAVFEFWLSHPSVSAPSAQKTLIQEDRLNSTFWILRRFNSCDHLH